MEMVKTYTHSIGQDSAPIQYCHIADACVLGKQLLLPILCHLSCIYSGCQRPLFLQTHLIFQLDADSTGPMHARKL